MMGLSLLSDGEVSGGYHAHQLAEDTIVFEVGMSPRDVVQRVGVQRPDGQVACKPDGRDRPAAPAPAGRRHRRRSLTLRGM
jgi:hypothetical protein